MRDSEFCPISREDALAYDCTWVLSIVRSVYRPVWKVRLYLKNNDTRVGYAHLLPYIYAGAISCRALK